MIVISLSFSIDTMYAECLSALINSAFTRRHFFCASYIFFFGQAREEAIARGEDPDAAEALILNGGVPPAAQAPVAPVQQQPQQPQTTGLEGVGKGLDISGQVMAERDNGYPRRFLLCKFLILGLSLVYGRVTKHVPRWPRVTAVAMEDSCAEEPIDIDRSCRSSCQKNDPGHEWYTGDHARNVYAMIRRTPITVPDLCTDHWSCTCHRARNVTYSSINSTPVIMMWV